MSSEDVSLRVAAAVFVGAAILIGPPATGLILGFLRAVLDALGLGVPFGATTLPGTLAVFAWLGLTLFFWLQISYEAASLQLYGVEGLHRGPRWVVLTRHLLLSLTVVVLLAAVTRFGVWIALEAESLVTTMSGVLLGIAGIAVILRAVLFFKDGLSQSADS